MLVELGLVEQRYAAVKDVLDNGATVTDVARRNGVAAHIERRFLRGFLGDVVAASAPDVAVVERPVMQGQLLASRTTNPARKAPKGAAASFAACCTPARPLSRRRLPPRSSASIARSPRWYGMSLR